ncbi:putative polyols ABC transporter, permease component 1 [Vibrio nigripulchritudo MADA3029]|uniref:Polyols ABC transporter, permease component 1 n=3 Tax=Vibrio nigripulchritudo TaxID=28173 RepID=A0AAV2VUG8_9VIBR|nr:MULTISPECIES: sugar ABC transporter permease [Vibrio]KJY76903.1 sugar ABC transporter permease [Vibrio nigripulchritudo]UAB68743.1 sugar ABC transporter permease [Vibrio sp. SCSIO 43132]CCN34470.1 putative polyols ABC transporter, permease component 1 [Vibrio nigripulchritudo AM115]CCN43274.1 putative polyols ABC transporter, permease component 1 [Vibrio nigripulchritudo FTn2]CCN45957.1 putative polyols ABC transporter, permease component 1 [Vibrio nigripulchritudo MADA3020]
MQRWLPKILVFPSFISLLLWMVVPLSMTIYFSVIRYNLLYPGENNYIGGLNFEFFYTDEAFWPAVTNTLTLVGMVLVVTVIAAVLIAVLLDKPFKGRGIVRVLLISPFFIMPTVNALIWKNLMMHPVYGVLASLWESVGLEPVDWLSDYPLGSIIAMLSWQWMPFALLIFMTSLQSMDTEQKEAAVLDGANGFQVFRYLTLPHLARPIAVVMMIETIFLLSVFAEIFVTTSGGPGYESTNLAFLIFAQALMQFDVGVASAGGLIAVILANIVAFFLIRAIGKNLVA